MLQMIAIDVIIIIVLTSPLLLLELLKKRFEWIDRHHIVLHIVLWFLVLSLIYTYVLPVVHRSPAFSFMSQG